MLILAVRAVVNSVILLLIHRLGLRVRIAVRTTNTSMLRVNVVGSASTVIRSVLGTGECIHYTL